MSRSMWRSQEWAEIRFTEKDPRIEMVPESGCWVWMSVLGGDGYGQASLQYKTGRAHRIFWQTKRGPIPEGMVLDHVCRVRSCVNPDHLRVVTNKENVLRNSRSLTAINAAKTHCPKCGGQFARILSGKRQGKRICIPCRAAKDKRNQADRRHRLLAQGAKR